MNDTNERVSRLRQLAGRAQTSTDAVWFLELAQRWRSLPVHQLDSDAMQRLEFETRLALSRAADLLQASGAAPQTSCAKE